jgi:uncharacterized membrane protein
MVVRFIQNLFWTKQRVSRFFSQDGFDRIENAVKDAEKGHRAEIKVVIEGGMPTYKIMLGVTSAQRARELFTTEKIGITAGRTGILVYILMAERRIEILSDNAVVVSSGTLNNWTELFTSRIHSQSNISKDKNYYVLDSIIEVLNEIGNYCRDNFADPDNPDVANEICDKPKII